MPLLDLKTNLKDLKFGHDQYKWGSSNEPYVATRIPATNEPLQTGFSNVGEVLASAGAGAAIGALGGSILGSTGAGALVGTAVGLGIGVAGVSLTSDGLKIPQAGTGGPDFLLRGGTLLPNAVVDDEVRLTKFFADTKGILFTVKQNLLSRIAVKTQASPKLLNGDVYTPISSLVEAAGIPFGLHVNKQGLNPFEGIGESFTPNQYFKNPRVGVVDVDKNRLYNLYYQNVAIIKDDPRSLASAQALANGIAVGSVTNLLSYSGGPGASLGIGTTDIRYATDNSDSPSGARVSNVETINNETVGFAVLNYEQLNEIAGKGDNNIDNYKYPKTVDFRVKLKGLTKVNETLISNAPSYDPADNQTLEQRVNLGDPGNSTLKNLTSYVSGVAKDTNSTIYGAASENSYDKINALRLYESEKVKSEEGNDLVKFRIGVLNNDSPTKKTYIHFRAFLNQITDSYKADWNSTQYIGRGEKFYTYSGFDRTFSLSWTVAAQSKAELIPMYQKLNYLASICAPDYSSNGYMRGNIVTLTVGGYLYEQYGIITGLSYEMNDDNSTWEIGIDDNGGSDDSVKELPHMIKVTSFNFIPIHNFVPRKQQNTFNKDGILTKFGDERYIALNTRNNNNYDNINYILPSSQAATK